MSRISLDQIRSLPDIISPEAYELDLGTIPGGGNSRNLTLKCLNCLMPGFSNESYEVPLAGHVVNFRGRKMYQRIMQVTYVEDSKLDTFNALMAWHEFIVGSISGNSVEKKDYSVTARLTVYNQQGNPINDMELMSCFLQDVPDVQLSGEQSTYMQIQCSFRYDYFRTAQVALQ